MYLTKNQIDTLIYTLDTPDVLSEVQEAVIRSRLFIINYRFDILEIFVDKHPLKKDIHEYWALLYLLSKYKFIYFKYFIR